jgi:transposase
MARSTPAKPHGRPLRQAQEAARPWLTVEWLPKYAPELNDIERSWRDLKCHFLAHQTFSDLDHLDRAIHKAIANMNRERQTRVCTNLRIAA